MGVMNTRQLEYFVTVAETLSFTKTAEKYYISQTAVTQQIKALEEQLDVVLLKRTKRSVELTPAGNVFLTQARSILSQIDLAISKTQQVANGFFGTLSIGIISGYEQNQLADILHRFSNSYPSISLDIQRNGMTELLDSIDKKLLDVAFVINPEQRPLKDFEYKSMGRYSLVALLPPTHPLAHHTSIELHQLSRDKFIFVKETGDEYGQKSMVQDRYREAGFIPHVVQRCNDFNTIVLMVAANMGVALLPSFAISKPYLLETVRVVPIAGDTERIEVVAAYHKNNTNPALERFLSIL